MSLLTICQNAAIQLSLPSPPTVINSSDEIARLMLRLAQEEGESLMRRYPWQKLIREKTFAALAQEVQTSIIPDDFDRILPDTVYNRTTRRKIGGPISAEEWANDKANVVTFVFPVFRVRGDDWLMLPNPGAGEVIAFEYVSKNFCKSDGGTRQALWVLDSDIGILDESLMTLGLVWRVRQAKGLPYGEDLALYEKRVIEAMMRDGTGKRSLTGAPPVFQWPPKGTTPETIVV